MDGTAIHKLTTLNVTRSKILKQADPNCPRFRVLEDDEEDEEDDSFDEILDPKEDWCLDQRQL